MDVADLPYAEPKGAMLGKAYEFETQKGLLVALEPPMAMYILGKSTAMAIVMEVVHQKPGKKDKAAVPKAMAMGVFKETCYVTTKSTLQLSSAQWLSRRTAHKLMKDVHVSALRKLARYHSKEAVARHMLKTGAVAAVLGHVAVYLVNEALYCWQQCQAVGHEKDSKELAHLHQLRRLKTLVYAIVLQGAGCAVGTLVKPGKGTYIGGVIGGAVAYMM